MPVTTFPIILGLQSMFFFNSILLEKYLKYYTRILYTGNTTENPQEITSCNKKHESDILCGLINMQWWCVVSLGILHCSLTCLPVLAVWRCSLANHGVWRWAFHQWECKFHGAGCAELLFIVHQMAEFLGWLPGATSPTTTPPTKEVKFVCMPAALIPSCVCVWCWTVFY